MDIVYRAIIIVISIIEYAILARIVISWLPISKDNNLIRLLYQFTEPVLAPIRRIIEKSYAGKNMMLDFSPIVAFLLLGILKNILSRLLIPGQGFIF